MVHEYTEMGLAVVKPLIVRGRNLDRMSDLAWEIRSGDVDQIRHWVTACLHPFGLLTQKCHRLGGFSNTCYFSKSLSLGSPRSGCQQIWCLMRVPFPVDQQPLSCSSALAEREHALVFLFILGHWYPTVGAPPSWPHPDLIISPEALPPNTIPLGAGLVAYEWGGGT